MRNHDMLRDDIWEFVSMSGYKTLDGIIARAYEQEIEFQLHMMHKLE